MKRHLPHLQVTNYDLSTFTSPSQGGRQPAFPERNRSDHANWLNDKLEKAWEDANNDEIAYHTTRSGVYLEVKGEAGYELITKSLENLTGKDTSKHIRLLNVRKENETTLATIFVPKKSQEKFFKKFKEYATKDVNGKPKNSPLATSISNITKALEIESFWQDPHTLIPKDTPEWCEVWLSSDKDDALDRFEALLIEHEILTKSGAIKFPERTVKIVLASRSQLETISRASDDIAEYRLAKQTASFWTEIENWHQVEWIESLLERIEVDPNSEISVCILDTGVNCGHPLLKPILAAKDCQSFDNGWGTHDHHSHGTLMAGVAAYGNLQATLLNNETVQLQHNLESVKLLPPTGDNGPELWGHITEQCVYKAEIQAADKKRIICMAVTSDDSLDRGRPSSWSAHLDQISSGSQDNFNRLIIVSAGNTAIHESTPYPAAQLTKPVQDPAQAWNALTVGAYTELDQIQDPTLSGYKTLSPTEGLSPFTTTSLTWDDKWPIKPEIVMEGGNLAIDSTNFVTDADDLSILSTYFDPQTSHFKPFNMTSAATAQAANFAAKIQAEYPQYWPETIRALIVHSAEWSRTLKDCFLNDNSKTSYKRLLRICGYGIPNIERALYCAQNSLTLVAEAKIQPYEKDGSNYRTKDMHLYELPWPKDILESLPTDTQVQMRITLSYFVEPGPGEVGWKDRYRYASCGLRFDLNSPTENNEQFLRRVNAAARDDGEKADTSSPSDYWTIGKARDKGSIHSDIWTGSATDLASSNLIAIYPTIGWWRERKHLNKCDKETRYALIISIETPDVEVELYNTIAIQLGVPIAIEIPST
ncbi:MAG: peptidase S8 [Desulfobacteraceae bacterium 4572_35.2]|nr:MAG: peptidase S8 [Desulfobacteraceae bacterium 4572_35.2]